MELSCLYLGDFHTGGVSKRLWDVLRIGSDRRLGFEATKDCVDVWLKYALVVPLENKHC